MKHLTWFGAAALVIILNIPAQAHHSLAATYRLDEMQTIYGTVVQATFREPHPLIHVAVVDRDGITRRWSVEWDDAAGVANEGVSPSTLRVGDRVRIAGHPGRNEETYRLLLVDISSGC